MNKPQKGKPSLLVKLAILGILGIGIAQTFSVTQWVDDYIAVLPVLGQAAPELAGEASAKAPGVPPLDRNLAPLLRESREKRNSSGRAGEFVQSESIETLFGNFTPEERSGRRVRVPGGAPDVASDGAPDESAQDATKVAVSLPDMPVIDYFMVMAKRIRVDALTPEGAILDGRLYRVGEPIESGTYPTGPSYASTGVLVLKARTDSGVVIGERASSQEVRIELSR